MKKNYVKPEMEITEFDTEDVITTSTGTNINSRPETEEIQASFDEKIQG